jgi:excisionase family DNA binding protein
MYFQETIPFFINKKQAARWLGVSLRTVDVMVALGELPVRRIGRRVVISQRALQEFARRDHPTRTGRSPISKRSGKTSPRKQGRRGR